MKFIKEKALTKSTKDGAALVIARNKAMKAFKHYKTCEAKPHAAMLKVMMKLWPGLTINCAYSKCFIIVHYSGIVLDTVEVASCRPWSVSRPLKGDADAEAGQMAAPRAWT